MPETQESLATSGAPWLRMLEPAFTVGRASRRLRDAGVFVLDQVARSKAIASEPAPQEPRDAASRLKWVCENLCALHGLDVRVDGRMPRSPSVLVANHLSYLDPVVILAEIEAAAVAKREVADWPILGETLDHLGILFVERGCSTSGARVLLRAKRLLDAGVSVLVFPEGTTTYGDDVLPFRRGAFGLARRLGVPVVPIGLRYDSTEPCWVGEASFLPHYVKTTSRRATRAHLTFGDPMRARGRTSETFAEDVRSVVRMLAHRAASAA
jgi:1-acyl-sn-glycerol-3-phosphate acyltransferase